MTREQLKQKLESVANMLRTALLVERSILTMTRTVMVEQVAEIDAMSEEWAYEDDKPNTDNTR